MHEEVRVGRVLVVVNAFEDFEVGDMIIEDDGFETSIQEEHRNKAVSVSIQAPIGHDPVEN